MRKKAWWIGGTVVLALAGVGAAAVVAKNSQSKKDKDGNRSFTAVPEDRDIAFFKGDGVLPYLISRRFAIRNFQNFGYDYADYKGLNQTGMSNDRVFMSGVTRADWIKEADYMKAHLTDAVIEKAFRDKWPKEIYDLHAREIIAKLKSRRDLLPDLAGPRLSSPITMPSSCANAWNSAKVAAACCKARAAKRSTPWRPKARCCSASCPN